MARKSYEKALSWYICKFCPQVLGLHTFDIMCKQSLLLYRFESVLGGEEQRWVSECLLLKGLALWHSGNSRASYATLLKVR